MGKYYENNEKMGMGWNGYTYMRQKTYLRGGCLTEEMKIERELCEKTGVDGNRRTQEKKSVAGA